MRLRRASNPAQWSTPCGVPARAHSSVPGGCGLAAASRSCRGVRSRSISGQDQATVCSPPSRLATVCASGQCRCGRSARLAHAWRGQKPGLCGPGYPGWLWRDRVCPGVRNQESGARSQEPGARSQEPGARSQEPGARSQEPGARSQEPGARSQEPGARSRPEACGGLEPGARGRVAGVRGKGPWEWAGQSVRVRPAPGSRSTAFGLRRSLARCQDV